MQILHFHKSVGKKIKTNTLFKIDFLGRNMYYVYLEKYVLCLFREICIMFIWRIICIMFICRNMYYVYLENVLCLLEMFI